MRQFFDDACAACTNSPDTDEGGIKVEVVCIAVAGCVHVCARASECVAYVSARIRARVAVRAWV